MIMNAILRIVMKLFYLIIIAFLPFAIVNANELVTTKVNLKNYPEFALSYNLLKYNKSIKSCSIVFHYNYLLFYTNALALGYKHLG